MHKDLPLFLSQIFDGKRLIQASFSSPHITQKITKVGIRPFLIKNELQYQLSEKEKEKVKHRNVDSAECQRTILEDLIYIYRQAILFTAEGDFHLQTDRKGETHIVTKPASKSLQELSHNRAKNHLLPEGAPVSYLTELGIMNTQGRVFPDKRDKFKQINRFLEMVADTLSTFQEAQVLHVVDFCCGKAYLTFALFHFLKEKGYQVQMTGLDLKEEVITECQKIAGKLGFDGLSFQVGDISSYNSKENLDMAVALHACDIATDIALEKAIHLKAKVILSAPCCQKELKSQIASDTIDAILQHGILQERMAAMATDAARAELLEMQGYATQVVEFIASEHTAKNILIRAIYGNSEKAQERAKLRYQELKKALHIEPILEGLLEKV
jgi:SAM-dependent methyltransferase